MIKTAMPYTPRADTQVRPYTKDHLVGLEITIWNFFVDYIFNEGFLAKDLCTP